MCEIGKKYSNQLRAWTFSW